MKEIMLGRKAGRGAAETLHVTDGGRLAMTEGDWLYETFKRKAKYQTGKNGFNEEDARQMEAQALVELLHASYGYDASRAKPAKGPEEYLNAIVGNAFVHAAKIVADERSVWQSRQSLDAAAGEDGEATIGERVTDGATLLANAKFWGEPRCRIVARKLAEAKADERAKRRLLERLRGEVVADGRAEDEAGGYG